MVFTTFEYPLPNNGERYDLSEDELRNLLDKAYKNGQANSSLECITTTASTKKSNTNIEQIFNSLIEEAKNEPLWKAENALRCAKKEIVMNKNENEKMTNKEAIQIIETAITEIEWEYPMNYAVAFDKAIEALKFVEEIRQRSNNI